jgi:ankyrin repeat protein
MEELLRYSIDNRNTGLLNALLIHRVIDPNKLFETGGNALTIAVEKRSAMAVELLLKHGADPALDIYAGNTPLHMALRVTCQEPQVIKALLDHGS